MDKPLTMPTADLEAERDYLLAANTGMKGLARIEAIRSELALRQRASDAIVAHESVPAALRVKLPPFGDDHVS